MTTDPAGTHDAGPAAAFAPARPGRAVRLSVRARSHRGRVRGRNEDAALVGDAVVRDADAAVTALRSELARPLVCAVFDGVGGAPGGDVASRLAAEALAGALGGAAGDLAAPVLLDTARLAIATADAAVRARGAADPALAGLGTTCTAFVVTASAVVVAHAGDSRLYRLRDGVLAACTRDHVAWVPHPDGPARAVLTSCLGVGRVPEVEVHDLTSRVHPGDRYLLATDGLTAALGDTIATDEVVARLLAAPDGDARLVEAALAAGAPDNVSVVRIAIDAV